MVLQDKYARAASRRYQRTHALTPDQAAEHAAVDAALKEAEVRRLGTNAARYKEWDEEEKGERGGEGEGKERVLAEEEVDEEEQRRRAEEKAELDAFVAKQREKLLTSPSPDLTAADGDDSDVDYSFAHLRVGGKGTMAPPAGARLQGLGRGRAKVEDEKDLEELRKMQDEARHMQAVRDLKDRFSGNAPRSGASASSTTPLRPKPGVQPASQGQDFLDTLL
ncbi:hypothetical protein Rt10032_c08g3565 [Rhodotorula toruloides]|uniref:Uncharacterized protein n=1 Tax=Rhodotorula toruloides TaxID=5286 RepID=A0A511KGP8_RHOTO|nr:hypothetical protein Rt10032_c08g3565 [Rhodotorula toruloides]